jgi:hypothetical protein
VTARGGGGRRVAEAPAVDLSLEDHMLTAPGGGGTGNGSSGRWRHGLQATATDHSNFPVVVVHRVPRGWWAR